MGCVFICGLLASASVEPLAFLSMIAVFFLLLGEQQFFYYKLCMINYNDTSLCGNLSAHPKEEDRIQTETARWMLYSDSLCYGLSAFSMLILGAWSDRVGRKPPLILVCVGGAVLGAVLLASAVWIHLPMPFMLVGWACFGICGSQGILLSSMLSYIADITSIENRVMRMGILQGVIALSSVTAMATEGLLANSNLFELLFGIFILLFVLSTLYIVFCLKESLTTSHVSKNKATDMCSHKSLSDHETDPLIRETDFCDRSPRQAPQEEISSRCGQISQCVTLSALLVVCAHKRPGHGRLAVILLLVCFFLLNLVYYGFASVFVLYALKAPIMWSPLEIGICTATAALSNGVVVVTVLPVAKLARIDVRTIAGLSCVLLCIGYTAIGFARSTLAVWLGVVPLYVFELLITVYYVLMSTLVSPDEQGRAMALMDIMVTLAHLAASAVFNNLYPATLNVLSGGLSFLVMGGITVIQLGLFLCVNFLLKHRQV